MTLVLKTYTQKWQIDKPNLQVGDVLLKDAQVHRSEWLVGLIVKTVPSNDSKVRKVEVKVMRQGTPRVYLRPISEVVFFLKKETYWYNVYFARWGVF